MALEAGCEQRPNGTTRLGLSGSVSSNDLIDIVAPSTSKTPEGSSSFSTAAIAGIACGGAALIAIVVVVLCIRCRRRRNRSDGYMNPRWRKGHKRRSSFSFKCRNILASPLTPKFFSDLSPVEEYQGNPSLDAQIAGAVGTQQGRYYIESKPKPQRHPYETALNGERSQSHIPEQMSMTEAGFPDQWNNYRLEKKATPKKVPITINTTDAALALPPAAHKSPRNNVFNISPASSTQYSSASPATAALYTPVADYTQRTTSPSQTSYRSTKSKTTTMSSQGNGYPNLNNQGSTSPLLRQQQQQQQQHPTQQRGWPSARERQEPWFPPPPPSGPPPSSSARFGRKVSSGVARKGRRESGSPVESKQIQVSFPAPP